MEANLHACKQIRKKYVYMYVQANYISLRHLHVHTHIWHQARFGHAPSAPPYSIVSPTSMVSPNLLRPITNIRTASSGLLTPTTELIELRPRRPRLERLHRAPTTSTTDHVDHVLSGSTELRPPRPPDHVAMMIATKNGTMTTATTVTTGRKARGPDNFITID